MKSIWLFIVLFPIIGTAQTLQYSPNRKLDKTVAEIYYNTEFMFIKNISDKAININYELIEDTFLPEWNASFCTNAQCFNQIPNTGTFGSIAINEEAYVAFNFGANQTIGEGQLRFLISSPDNQDLNDTITFKYTVTEDGTVKAGPWADITYAQGVLTVFLENPNLETTMQVFNLQGKTVFNEQLSHITSIPLRDHSSGMYLIIITDANDRILQEKVLHI